ncbi:MAG: hypothetical protein ACRECH_13650, partial [Nitrososphaerales archaeon]
LVLAALGYIVAQSVPIAALGFAVGMVGALVLLIVPEPVPQDAFRALLNDSIRNVEIILEESQLKERAYFVKMDDGEVRAFIPLPGGIQTPSPYEKGLAETLNKAPTRFIMNFSGLRGVLLIPPGNEIVKLSKVQRDEDVEESLRAAIIGFSDLAGSILAVEEEGKVKVQISKPKLSSESPYFNECLGSPVSCIASCVVAAVKGSPVRILDEKFDNALARLTLRVVE